MNWIFQCSFDRLLKRQCIPCSHYGFALTKTCHSKSTKWSIHSDTKRSRLVHLFEYAKFISLRHIPPMLMKTVQHVKSNKIWRLSIMSCTTYAYQLSRQSDLSGIHSQALGTRLVSMQSCQMVEHYRSLHATITEINGPKHSTFHMRTSMQSSSSATRQPMVCQNVFSALLLACMVTKMASLCHQLWHRSRSSYAQ